MTHDQNCFSRLSLIDLAMESVALGTSHCYIDSSYYILYARSEASRCGTVALFCSARSQVVTVVSACDHYYYV